MLTCGVHVLRLVPILVPCALVLAVIMGNVFAETNHVEQNAPEENRIASSSTAAVAPTATNEAALVTTAGTPSERNKADSVRAAIFRLSPEALLVVPVLTILGDARIPDALLKEVLKESRCQSKLNELVSAPEVLRRIRIDDGASFEINHSMRMMLLDDL